MEFGAIVPKVRSSWRVGAALSQWRALYLIVGVIVVAGIVTVLSLPEQVYPTLNYSRVMVIAENGDLAPPLVQASISRPLEQQLSSVLGVVNMTANSTQGASAISVTFDPHIADANVALQRVSTAVSTVQTQLPSGTTLTVLQVDPSLFPVLGYALSSSRMNAMQLREFAKYQLKPQILGLPGVSLVSDLGGAVREYLVSVDPQRLAAHHLTVEQLTDAIARTNTVNSVGHTDNGYVRSTILAMGQAHSAADIADIPVANAEGTPITVGMLAAVVQAPAPPLWAASTAGHDAVLVNVFAQHGASFVGVANVVNAAIARVQRANPDVRISRFWNQGLLVSDAIASLREAIIIGLILSTLVLYFFLRNWSSTIVAATVIPLTIVMTFAFMGPLHQSLNLMTLGGLAIGVGLIIDDAIVVVENIYRHIGRGEERATAISAAVSEIAAPMISSTFTTIVVFAPLALLSGVAGAFFTALAITLSVALVLSLLLALAFTPTMASQSLKVTASHVSHAVDRIERAYEPALRWALRRRSVVIAGAVVLLALTALLGRSLGTDFMPALDEGAFELNFRMPPGTTLAETRRAGGQIEQIVSQDPAVASEAMVIGQTMTFADTPAGTNQGTLRATLKPKGTRAPIATVIEHIQDRIHGVVPAAQLSTKQLLADMLNDLSNEAAPIEIRVFGPDQATLVPIAADIASRMQTIPGVTGVFSGAIYHNPSLVVRPDPRAGAFGLTPAQVATCEAVAYGGDVVSSVVQNPLTIPIRVRYPGPLDPNLAQVENAVCPTPSGSLVPLSRLATFLNAPPQTTISEMNQRQYISVTAQMNGSNVGAIASGIQQRLRGISLPPGYSLQLAGAYQLQNQSFGQFALAIALSVALVFLVMLLQFRSFVQPLAIVLTVPLALFGAFLALYISGQTLNVSSLMGLILLVGLVVKNGILLLEYTHRAEARGEPPDAALLSAARVRLRPIVMTTLTALLGMLPLAFAIGSGSELLQPLAIAVLGGLTFSTLFTLIVIPVIYRSLVGVAAGLERRALGEVRGHA